MAEVKKDWYKWPPRPSKKNADYLAGEMCKYGYRLCGVYGKEGVLRYRKRNEDACIPPEQFQELVKLGLRCVAGSDPTEYIHRTIRGYLPAALQKDYIVLQMLQALTKDPEKMKKFIEANADKFGIKKEDGQQ